MSTDRAPLPTHDDDAIRARLVELTSDYSQAELSRRTGVPQPSLSSYLSGRRIPADICARLTRELGVNADWLITGAGSIFSADVTAAATDTGVRMLEMVETMNRARRGLIGNFGAVPTERAARDLARRVEDLQAQRRQLDAVVNPVVSNLLDDFMVLLKSKSKKRATALIGTIDQLLRLCEDDELRTQYEGMLSHFAVERGDLDRALEIQRRLFLRSMMRPLESFEAQSLQDCNYVALLFMHFRIREAQRVSHALIALHGDKRDAPSYWQYVFTSGLNAIHLGDMRGGLSQINDAYARLPEIHTSFYRANFLVGPILAGTLDFDDAVRNEVCRARHLSDHGRHFSNRALVRIALMLDDPAAWLVLPEHMADELERSGQNPLLALQYRALRAIAERRPFDLDRFLEANILVERRRSTTLRDRVFAAIYAAQVARHAGADRRALAWIDESEDLISGMDRELDVWITFRILHARNATQAIPKGSRSARRTELRRRSQRWLSMLVDRGFASLTRMVAQSQ